MALDMTALVPLVTGGGSGIGYGLVKQLLALGCPKVIITGRTEARLQVGGLTCSSILPLLQIQACVSWLRLTCCCLTVTCHLDATTIIGLVVVLFAHADRSDRKPRPRTQASWCTR